jgi:hypothetical protein
LISLLPAFILFFGAFYLAGFTPRGLVATFLSGRLTSKYVIVRSLAALACFVGLNIFFYAFSFLAANGQDVHAGQIKLQDLPVSLGRLAFLVTIWLLLGVPNQAHMLGLKKEGYAQRILVRAMTVGVCLSGGVYFFSEHLHSGPLRDVHTGPLVVGIVFAAVLVAPICSSIERAIWQQGIAGVLSSFSAKALRSFRDFARKEWPLRGSPADVRSR